jgi:beta propeller repeat protein
MRNLILLWVCCIFIVCVGVVNGEFYKVLPVCEDTLTQSSPDVSGNLVVWEDQRGIYGKYLPDGDVFQISDNTDAAEPVVSGDVVVWTDKNGDDYDIKGFNLDSNTLLPVCTKAGKQQHPAIEGNIVVWQDERNTEKDIYGWNLDTEQELEIFVKDGANQYYPDVGEDFIVWMDNRNATYDIYAKQIGEDANSPVHLSTNSQFFPSVHNGVVVWQENDNIYGYDLIGMNEFDICTAANGQSFPKISGDRVVWQDERSDDGDIYMHNLAADSTAIVCNDAGEQKNPVIDGDIIVWESSEDIYYAQPVSLQITYPDGGEMLLAGGQSEIKWQSTGPISDYIKLEYSTDNGSNWQVIDANAENTGAYEWGVPVVDANQCLLRVSDTGDENIAAVSEAVFTIFECSQQLTADITGDCVVDISDFAKLAGQWLMCGNPHDQTWCRGD